MLSLGMFFTRGVSLRQWVESGLFDREVFIYHAHIDSEFFSRIYWLTYGTDDAKIANELHRCGKLSRKIEVVPCPQWMRFAGRLSSVLYSILLPIVAKSVVAKCDVLKTNQMEGSVPALICSAIWQRPLYLRTGYTLSLFVKKTSPGNWFRNTVAILNEFFAFKLASVSSVSSCYDRDYIVKRYGATILRPIVVGNYVDTMLFSPSKQIERIPDRVLYVGRLDPQKNIDSAIVACSYIGMGLDIAGAGEDLPRLQRLALKVDASVRWFGVVQNNELPNLYRRYKYFILASLWEGLPKALIEAMSVGLVCIGNDTTGINEIIKDEITGYLSPSADATALAKTLRRAIEGDHDRISCAGREYACNNFSIDAIATKERALFTSILARGL
jgi:glycosyltransferase involved in cell wall biosynthesis